MRDQERRDLLEVLEDRYGQRLTIVNHGAFEDGVHFLAKHFTADQILRAVRRAMGGE